MKNKIFSKAKEIGNGFKKSKRRYEVMAKQQKNPMAIDYNMLFGKEIGLSLDNEKTNRSANVLVIGGTGTGKTFRYIKPNILQENCSQVITDPSGDLFQSFAPYLIQRGYNVYLFNVSDMTFSNHYNPLMNVYDSFGNISEIQVDILVDLYMKNAKAGKEVGGADPFWDKAEKAFLTAIAYYVLENDEIPMEDKCFRTMLEKVQLAKVSDEDSGEDAESPLTQEINAFVEKCERAGKKPKTKIYYDTFLVAPSKTANTILITTAVDLQIFATENVDRLTRYNAKYPDLNINLDDIASTQSYLFLGIPQAHQAYNFLIAMVYSQLYGRLYELGENGFTGKWLLDKKKGIPSFNPFDTKEEAEEFRATVTKYNIKENDYINGLKIYYVVWNGKIYKKSFVKERLEELIDDLPKMSLRCNDKSPELPIHTNFLLDEFKNIGEIPNFLTILSTSRKYRIGSHVIIQDVGQIKTMYNDGEHETLLANVDATIFLGSILQEDREFIQKLCGKTTIKQRSTSSQQSGLSTSYTPTEVDLLSINDITRINNPKTGQNKAIIVVRDLDPFVVNKLNLLEHPRFINGVKKVDKNFKLKQYFKNNEETILEKA